MFGSISILNTRYKRFAQVIALKTGFLQQMWRVTIVPLLADSSPLSDWKSSLVNNR
jgi:hypothetical protein